MAKIMVAQTSPNFLHIKVPTPKREIPTMRVRRGFPISIIDSCRSDVTQTSPRRIKKWMGNNNVAARRERTVAYNWERR